MEPLPSGLRNRYFVCPTYRDAPMPWDPRTKDTDIPFGHLAYLGGLFETMERTTDVRDLTFYVTWRLDVLPTYGPDVVAVVMGDEIGRYPLYTNRVRAVFKMEGTDFPLEANLLHTPPALTAITAVKYARTQALRMPHVLQARRDRTQGPPWTGGAPVPIYDIPIGYIKQDDLPMKPLSERAYDLYFSGSISNKAFRWYTPQYWLRSPKEVARLRMVAAMRALRRHRSDLRIEIDTHDTYVPRAHAATASPARSYSEMMMDTRICPVPRGTRLETGRLYEAMRYGCVLVCEPLPDRWFTRDLPAVYLHDWADLPAVVDDLLRHPKRMEALHRQTLAWWRRVCSEEAVARYIAERLCAPPRVSGNPPARRAVDAADAEDAAVQALRQTAP